MKVSNYSFFFSIILFLYCFDVKSLEFALVDSNKFSNLIVKTAIDNKSKKKGLMDLEELKSYNGMLFLYDVPTKVNFWMYRTLIPLDIIFIDKSNVITSMKVGEPLTKKIISSQKSVSAVLEIPAGCAKKLKIRKGDKINWILKSNHEIENIGYFHCLN